MSRPVRTCVGCRGQADKSELLRLVWRDGILVDLRQREPGRGAYLHRATRCVELAVRKRSLSRALRSPGIEAEALAAAVGDHLA